MAVKVLIPTPLQRVAGGKAELELNVSGGIHDLIGLIDEQYPGFKERICDENGKLRKFVNVYLNGEDIRFLDGDNTRIPDASEVSIVPAIAGGVSVQ